MKATAVFFVLLAVLHVNPLFAGEAEVSQLWGSPRETVGEKLQPTSPEYKLAELKGAAPEGRVGKLEPGSVISVPALAALKKGATVEMPLVGGEKLRGVVNLVVEEKSGWVRIGGALTGNRKGTFAFGTSGKGMGGQIHLPDEGLAYEMVLERDGQVLLREKALSKLMCVPMPREPGEIAPLGAGAVTAPATPPILSSRPLAKAVLYLDFDGEIVTDPLWNAGNTINALPCTLSSIDMTKVWEIVKEDFWPFDIDVTTDVRRYNSAPVGSRMRCIITPTSTAMPGSGGVAYVSSFSLAGTRSYSSDIPCWVFNSSVNGISEAISHELGHTVGLQHDGGTVANFLTTGPSYNPKEYYKGYSSPAPSWGPIMGAAYDRNVTQWSKGEYEIANNTEDDLAIIASATNGFGYVLDEAGATPAAAAALPDQGGVLSKVGTVTAEDVDVYRIDAGNGTLKIVVTPGPASPNLDVSAELLDAGGETIASHGESVSAMSATFSSTLAAGRYYLRIKGAGWANPKTGGWSSYGSIGGYTISGTLGTFTPGQPPVITSGTTVNGWLGSAFSYQIEATNNPSSFGVTGALPPGLSLDTQSGRISGTPSAEGTYPVTLRASNAFGTGTQALVITIKTSASFTLGEAVDAEKLGWKSTTKPAWFPQLTVSSDNEDAAQSGAIKDNESTALQVSVTGPATISFRWRVESEKNKDYLSFLIDDEIQNRITGKTNWVQRSFNIGSGKHTLKWIYSKDYSVSLGADAGWVDTFKVETAQIPVITSSTTTGGMVGWPFSYQIAASNSPSSYSFTGELPPGLSLNTANGKISGTPSVKGAYDVTVKATNSVGTGSAPLNIIIASDSLTIGDAVDATERDWTTGGTAIWSGQMSESYDGVDALRSGKLPGNKQQSWVQTTVTGPLKVSFRWKVDSESGKDFLRFKIDGATQASISGETEWQQRTFSIGAGSHVLRWSYEKDSTIAVGADAGWLDTVTFGASSTRIISLSGPLAFGKVAVGGSAQRTLTIGNSGDQALTVSSITYPKGYSGNWSGTIAPGGIKEVAVTFRPSTAATYAGEVKVNSNATEGASTLALSGAGASGGGVVFSAEGLPEAIRDRKSVTSTLVVSGRPSSMALNQIKLNLGVAHTSAGDLVVTLKPPKSPEIVIRRRAGGSANDLVISAEALSSSKTINPNGTWKLTIEDKKRDQEGSLQSWGLVFP